MRNPTQEEITDLFNSDPEFFAAVLGRDTVVGCTVIMPGCEPIYMEKRKEKTHDNNHI